MFKTLDRTKELQSQFGEQIKCLELKINIDNSILSDLNEFYKRRAVVEQEYADSLFRLVQNFRQRFSIEQQKRQSWPKYSSIDLINTLIVSSHRTSQTHHMMANIFSQQMTQRMLDVQDDVCRLHKQSKELLQMCQQNVTNTFLKLHKDHKGYQTCFQLADESKRTLEKAKDKFDKEEKRYSTKNKEFEKSNKFKKLKEDLLEKEETYESKKLACSQAKNEYIIQLASVNKGIEKFFSQEIHDVLECMSYGYHNNLSRAILNHINCEEALVTSHKTIVDALHSTMNNLDARRDTGMFLESCQLAFSRSPEIKFQNVKDDQQSTISTEGSLRDYLTNMALDLKSNINITIVEVDEIWKTIEEAAKILNGLISQNDYEVADVFLSSKPFHNHRSRDASSEVSATSSISIDSSFYTAKRNSTRDQRIEQEKFYINCLHKYLEKNHKYHTTAAKLEKLLSALGEFYSASGESPQEEFEWSLCSSTKITRQLTKKTHRRLGVPELQSKPRLFGGSLEDYIERTEQPIPLVIKICVQVINLYGMHHQGVFRIPGSQTEMNEYRELFESGDSLILTKKFGSKDVNSIAGMLKMYFRELVEPIFPNCLFNRLIECSKEDVVADICVANMSDVVSELSDSIYVVLRYLFAFLNHLSDYSEDNMMDPQNLAICFGPCLLPVPSDLSHLQFEYQPHVNRIVRLFIERSKDIFVSSHKKPNSPLYERFQPISAKRYSYSLSDDCLLENDNISDISLESHLCDEKSTNDENETNNTSDKIELASNEKDATNNTITRCQSTRSPTNPKTDKSDDDIFAKTKLTRKLSDSEIRSMIYATTLADFNGVTERELSFCKGQVVKLHRRLNQHWWEGCLNDSLKSDAIITPFKIGLIPHSYLQFNFNPKDFLSLKKLHKSTNEEETVVTEESQLTEKVSDNRYVEVPVNENSDANSNSTVQNSDIIDTNNCSHGPNDHNQDDVYILMDHQQCDEFKLDEKNDDELSLDCALAEMMQGFVNLEQQNTIRLRTSSRYRLEEATVALEKKFISPLSKHTPDLVRDLVSKRKQEKPSYGCEDDSETSSLNSYDLYNNQRIASADTFAEQINNTVRKKLILPSAMSENEDCIAGDQVVESCNIESDNSGFNIFNDESTPSITAKIFQFESQINTDHAAKTLSTKVAPPLAPKPKRN